MTQNRDLKLLSGIKVIELGGGIAGSAATAMLSDLGAEVTTYPVGGLSRQSAGPRQTGDDHESASYLSLLMNRGKSIFPSSTLGINDARIPEACEGADIVLCDLIEGTLADCLSDLDQYQRFVSQTNGNAWITISPFGLSGPYRSYLGSELICAAAGGMNFYIRAKDDDQPIKLAGLQALVGTGQVAALAALHGLDLARRERQPTHIDVSAQEALILTNVLTRCGEILLNSHGDGSPGRSGPPFGFYPCQDGLVHINVMESHQWGGVVKAMGFSDWATGNESVQDRWNLASEIETAVPAWTSVRKKSECVDELQKFGVPVAPLNTPTDILESPQFAYRDFFRPVDLGGSKTVSPGLPFYVDRGKQAENPTAGPASGIKGLRVLEFSHVVVAPFAGSLVGAMGADVVRVENSNRLDLYRRTGPFADDIAGENRGVSYLVNNHSKRSIVLDEDPSGAQLAELVSNADVVMENWGHRRASRAGIDAPTLAQTYDHLLALSSSGFGSGGPMGDYRAYAYNVHSFGGLIDLTRDRHGEIVNMHTGWGDYCSGLHLAIVIAAWAVGPSRGHSMAVDLSMAEVVASRLRDYVAAATVGDASSACRANMIYPFAPHNVYKTGGGKTWLALAVTSDEQWQAFQSVLGNPPSLNTAYFGSIDARWSNRDLLDETVQACLIDYDPDELFERLQGARVPACPIWNPQSLVNDPHLAERGFYVTIEHEELGTRRIVGLPWMIAGGERFSISSPPLLHPSA